MFLPTTEQTACALGVLVGHTLPKEKIIDSRLHATIPPQTEISDGGANVRLDEPDTAVILAAGLGSRLDLQTDVPKPLVKVGGVTLAERVVLALRAGGGVRRFIVTLGHRADVVGAHFEEIGRQHGVSINTVAAANWNLGNGASMLAAKGHTGRAPFYLSMSDHIFDPAIAEILADNAPGRGEMCLAVDRDKDSLFDLDDVTRVRTRAGRIDAIEKDLEQWDASDTGVMLCTTGLFGGLEQAAAEGRHGLSDGLRKLAKRGKAKIVDVTGRYWLDVDTPEAHREAEIQEHYRSTTGAYRHADGSKLSAPKAPTVTASNPPGEGGRAEDALVNGVLLKVAT